MEFFAVRHQQFREQSVIQRSAVTGTSPKCSWIPLISRREEVTNVPRYWLLLRQVQVGVGGNPVQNQESWEGARLS